MVRVLILRLIYWTRTTVKQLKSNQMLSHIDYPLVDKSGWSLNGQRLVVFSLHTNQVDWSFGAESDSNLDVTISDFFNQRHCLYIIQTLSYPIKNVGDWKRNIKFRFSKLSVIFKEINCVSLETVTAHFRLTRFELKWNILFIIRPFIIIKSNLSITATLGTEESGRYGEVGV